MAFLVAVMSQFTIALAASATYLVEAEDFQFQGDWLEERDVAALGSRILRTPGAKVDAVTVITLPQAGKYAVWVRARDFTEQPGTRRYKLALDGTLFEPEFGAHGTDGWKWEKAGERDLAKGDHVLALHDTARHFGRADAIFLTTGDVDPNTLTPTALRQRRLVPKTIAAERTTPFAPVPEIKLSERREVAKLENESVRVRFLSAPDATGKTQIIPETELNVNGTWHKLPVESSGEKLFVLFTPQTEIRTATIQPAWVTEPPTTPVYRFTVGGKTYESTMGRANPFFAAPAEAVIGRGARQVDAQTVQVQYETPSGMQVSGRWQLKPGARDVEFSLDFTAPQDGFYSFGFSPFQGWTKEQVQFNLLPPLYQFQRLPETPMMLGSNATPQPLALAQVEPGGQRYALAVIADPDRLPFEWATAQNSVYGFSLLNADGIVQPTIFSPVLGLASSQMKRGETKAMSWRVLAFPGDWKSALEYASNSIFKVTDYRQPYVASLTDAALNIIDLMKHDEASGWDAERKGFWNIETTNVASQASPLTVLSAAILTRDEELYKQRALPTIEYT
ncbi:MAG: hypothetical protein M3347_13105, partial [Armatimonadota bacterium]|nr:hypothetical protein [Armatimonadota bacterium]